MGLVQKNERGAFVTSKQIADSFGKVHRDVLRAVKNLDCSEEFRVRNFAQSSYTSEQNKTLDCFEITRDGFSFLCMGFTGKQAAKWKEAYIKAFNELERVSMSSMQQLNDIAKRVEQDKDAASFCGKELARYKKVKLKNEQDWKNAVAASQLQLGFGGE